jgi:trimeric autotransporter adhesin
MAKVVVQKIVRAGLLLTLAGTLALAQKYTISTLVGGVPPATPVAATSVSVGQPSRVMVNNTANGNGDIYFTANNTVFKIDSSGILRVVAGTSVAGYSGDGGPATAARLNDPHGLGIDIHGNLFIADTSNNVIRKVDSSGIITTFAGTGYYGYYGDGILATQANFRHPMGVTVDGFGNILVADTGNHAVRKILDSDGTIQKYAGNGYAGYTQDWGDVNDDGDYDSEDLRFAVDLNLNHPTDVFYAPTGFVFIADEGNERIRRVDAKGYITTVAGNGAMAYDSDGDPGYTAPIFSVLSVTADSSGQVYLPQSGDGRIRYLTDKTYIHTLYGTGTFGFSGDGKSATTAQFYLPSGIAMDSSGNMYIADTMNRRIRKITKDGTVSTIAGNGLYAYTGDGSAAGVAQLNSPLGTASDSSGNIYIADSANNAVRKIASAGTISTVLDSTKVNNPHGLAADSSGNIYIADTGNSRVLKLTSAGTVSTVAGTGTDGSSGDGGAATSATLSIPTAVAVDASGNLYIADTGNHRVRKVTSGGIISTFAGTGASGYAGDGASAPLAHLNGPQGVAVDGSGNVYIADTGNYRIRVVASNGTISTLAGTGLPSYSGDSGPAVSAAIGVPVSIAADSSGNVYIADSGSRIRLVKKGSGVITTIAGTGISGYTGDGSVATAAQLNSPTGLSFSSSGTLYLADSMNSAVRKLTFAGYSLTLASVANGASNLTGGIAPGEVVVLYGASLGPDTLVMGATSSSGTLATVAGSTRVYISGTAVPVYYASSTQVAAIVPYGLTGSTASLSVEVSGQASATLSVPVAAAAPGIFTINGSGAGQVLAFTTSGVLNSAAAPASAGSYVSLYLTGAGALSPAGVDGQYATADPSTPVQTVTATIGGKPATVQYAGTAKDIVSGVLQVNLEIPTGLSAGAVPVTVTVGSATSQSGATLVVTGS